MSDRARIVVVGLGPGDTDLLTTGTRAAIDAHPVRYLRTIRHPAARAVPDAISLDEVYETATTMAAVYTTIVERLVAAATDHGVVLYAVPGSPSVAERTVELLLTDDRIDVEVVPALSFLDLTWVRLGIDPVALGVRVVDGHRFAVEAAGERGPLLVAQCDTADVLSDIKLALDSGLDPCLGPDAQVVVLQRLGLPDERIDSVPWTDLDRIEADHLTSILLPRLAAPIAREFMAFVELVATLRAECPWDREQTHDSLRRHLLEESYEVLEALDHLDVAAAEGYDHLEEELGDLLFQILFHCRLAAEAGQFTIADVATNVHDKLRSRHPHVFGEVDAPDADAVVANWEQIKKSEKGRESVFDGVPDAIPALLYALKVGKKAASLPPQQQLPLDEVDPGAALEAVRVQPDEDTIGTLLMAVVDLARSAGVDPETALRTTALRRRDAARAFELSTQPEA